MAAIDKIYLTDYNQYLQFKDWCEKQPKIEDKYGKKISIAKYLYEYRSPFKGEHPVFNAPCYVDAYVIRNCPFDFIQSSIGLNYGEHTQDWINEAYKTVMDRGGEKDELGKDFWYFSKDDFEIINGVIKIKEKSTYQKIKDGELYIKPSEIEAYVAGKHIKCTKHPKPLYNHPFKGKWSVQVDSPEGYSFMWYNEERNTWDFANEFVIHGECSDTARCGTIKALKRLIRKWKYPVGTKVRVWGYYVNEEYEFLVTK